MESYFTPGYLDFFRELAANNNTQWFHANKKVYDEVVKRPFSEFVGEMIRRIRTFEPEIQIKPTDAIMRINNDIRFSKDKTPYKTHMSANISIYGKRDKGYPGFYFELSPEAVTLYGGVYMVDNPTLHKIRQYIVANHTELAALTKDERFVSKYGQIQGESHKRVPAEFKEAFQKEPLVANKQFYYSASIDPEVIPNDNLPELLMEYYHAGKGINTFFRKAMRG
jgi:uncharacterized protein (TIGR02453 family)